MESQKILVVDDEKHIVQLMEYNLKKQGYSVDTAFNGLDALHKINNNKPDLILLDIKMPVMNGYEVCLQLKKKEETRDIPIIVVSVLADSDQVEALGVESQIIKPFDPGRLIDAVKHILGKGVEEILNEDQ